MSTRYLRFDLGYDGTDSRGWAAQPGPRTVQGEVKVALAMASREDVVTTVVGRTDAGVRARHQVCHVDTSEATWARLSPRGGESDEQAMVLAAACRLNKILPGCYGERVRGCDLAVACGICNVRIYSVAITDPSFGARSSALGRSYAYWVSDRSESLGHWDRLWVEEPFNEATTNEAGTAFLGEHDLFGFCRPCEGATTTRALRALLAERDTERTFIFRVEADAFCYSMVCSLVGALLLVGPSARDVAYPVQIPRARSRSEAMPIAPVHGFTFEGVEYPDLSQWRARAEQARAKCDTCCGDDGWRV